MLSQNDLEYFQDMVQQGKMTADEANVEMVLTERVRIVSGSMPKQVRKALNEAVKCGKLRHIKKSGNKPEAYYHPNFEYLAKQEISKREKEVINAMLEVCTAEKLK